ncbi:MAG: DUF2793 domain-containing protein [Sphingomonadaceae bacterium]
MSETTARFGMPLLLSGQAQKEIFHNEALALLDAVVHPAAEDAGPTTPPAAPAAGQCWIVGAGAGGDWAGKDDRLACWSAGGWRFADPVEGMAVWLKPAGHFIHWRGGAWSDGTLVATRLEIGGEQVVGSRLAAISAPAGGSVVDVEARAALGAVIDAMMSHGLIS